MRRIVQAGVWAVLAVLAGAGFARAQLPAGPGDWPGWRGPNRTGLSTEKWLLKTWPAGGPQQVWKATGLGDGYSTPSVAAGILYLMGTQGKNEMLIALDAKDGKRVWDLTLGKETGGYPAPKSTPTVDGERIYALSSDGKLVCATLQGKEVWKKDLKADFSGQPGGWAYTESPLIDGEALVCTPGGESATLVALNKKTGEVIWKGALGSLLAQPKVKGRGRAYTTAAYSSVIVAEVGGVKQYVQFLSGGVVGVSAKDGKLLWHYDAPANGTANCSTPIFADGAVFAASAYGKGGGRANVVKDGSKFTAEPQYFLNSFQNHHGGVVLVDGYLYGTGGGSLMCVEFKTGKVLWNTRGVGKGSVTYADGCIYHRGENGEVALVEATPKAYTEKGRFSQPDRSRQKAWAYPVVAGGKLYLRDWDTLLCYEIKEK